MICKVYDNLVPGGWAEFQEWTCGKSFTNRLVPSNILTISRGHRRERSHRSRRAAIRRKEMD